LLAYVEMLWSATTDNRQRQVRSLLLTGTVSPDG